MIAWPLFWCLESEAQALLMQFQWDTYGQILEVPSPPQTSQGVWLAVQMENSEEIARLMKQPTRGRKVLR